MYLFFYMALGLNDFDGGKSLTRAIGRGGPSKRFFHIQIITSRAIQTTGTSTLTVIYPSSVLEGAM
jgi:hypothetical protein